MKSIVKRGLPTGTHNVGIYNEPRHRVRGFKSQVEISFTTTGASTLDRLHRRSPTVDPNYLTSSLVVVTPEAF